jgi:hypothetical protein
MSARYYDYYRNVNVTSDAAWNAAMAAAVLARSARDAFLGMLNGMGRDCGPTRGGRRATHPGRPQMFRPGDSM